MNHLFKKKDALQGETKECKMATNYRIEEKNFGTE